jgi:leucine-rich PPR motif-containing protein
MAATINLLLRPKSLLHRHGMSPLPRFRSTGTKCSQLIEAEGLTASKDIHSLRTKSNPPTLFEIFKQRRYQLPTPSTGTSFRLRNPLHIFKIESDPQKLVQIFKQSAEHPKFRSLQSPYEVTVKKLASAKQFIAIEEILDHSLQVSEPCSEAFIIRIILLYGIAGMPQHAIKTFNKMKSLNISPTVKSFNALLNALIESKNPKLVRDFYKDIDSFEIFGISANVKTYNIIVKAICEMNEHESALSFLDEMRKHGCEPDIFTYNTILSALYKQGKYKEADDLLGKMTETCPPDVITYNIRMSHLCECDKTSDAEKLLDEMVSKGLNPNIFNFNTLIAGYCKENNMTEAMRIFSDISRKGCDPDAVTYYTLISLSSKEGHFDTAYELYIESMRRNWMPNLKTANMLIDGLVKNNKVENAREVIEGMKKKLPVSRHKELENIS